MECINHVNAEDVGDNGPDCYEFTKPVAHKKHICDECGRIIQIGEWYLNERGKWDGHFVTFKTCVDCRSIRGSFFGSGFAYGTIMSELEQHIMDNAGEIGEIHMTCLTPAARGAVCDLIQECWVVQDAKDRQYRRRNERSNG